MKILYINSYNYVRDLAMTHFGVKDTELIAAEMLDVEGFDAEKIVEAVISDLGV